jgi:YHS domain-containing protein
MKKLHFILGIAAVAATLPLAVRAQDAPKPSAPVLCAVRGDEIKDVAKAAGKFAVNDKTYYVCCPGCKTAFEKADDAGKAKFAKLTDLRTEKVVLQRKLETLNKEIAGLEGKPAKITAAPAASGMVYCAVTDEEIGTPDKAAGGMSKFNGKTYYFCCPGCKTKFDATPTKFAGEADKKAAERAAKK